MIVPKFLLLYLPNNHEFAHYLRKKEVLLHVERGHANFILRRWEEILGREIEKPHGNIGSMKREVYQVLL